MDWFSMNWLVAPVSKRQQAEEVRRAIGNTDCRKNSLCDTEFTRKTCLKYIRQMKNLKIVFPLLKKLVSDWYQKSTKQIPHTASSPK